jgi:hypothetical protein
VNGALLGDGFARLSTIARIFATNAALTKQSIELGMPRSRFGPTDSWVIKDTDGAASAAAY